MDTLTSVLLGVIATLLAIIAMLLPNRRSHQDAAGRDELGDAADDSSSTFELALTSDTIFHLDEETDSEFKLTLDEDLI